MKIKSKYFLSLVVALCALALIDCASIILCVVNGSLTTSDKHAEQIMSFVYLFIHLIVIGFVIFLALKAYLIKSVLISTIMTNEDGTLNKKSQIYSLIFAIFGLALAVIFFLASIGIFKALTFFSLGLRLALTNVGFTIGIVAIFLLCYKPENSK